MPFIGKSPLSFVATADDIIAHWTRVNAELRTKPIVFKGGYSVADFSADRDSLVGKISAVRMHRTARELAASVRDTQKVLVRGYLTRFRGAVTSELMDTPYAKNLPTLPHPSADEQRYKEPFLKMAEQWRTINGLGSGVEGFTAPLVIGDDTTLDDYEGVLAALESSYRSLNGIENALDTSRRERDGLLPNIRKRAQQYKAALIARFGKEHAFVQSLPALSPTPGSTPDAVTLSAHWDSAQEQAVLSWSASPLSNVHYAVRTTGSLPYKVEDEDAVMSVPGSTLMVTTDTGLEAAGTVAHFKVYVVTKEGNERGSNAVKVLRPAA